MTPACRLLSKQKIVFSMHEYQHDPACTNFGAEAARALGLTEVEVFKTLLVTDGKQYFVCVLPVAGRLSLKKAAQALAVKRLAMALPADAERLTGYLVGAISPLAQKKRLACVIDASAAALAKMYVSGGKRGLDIGLAPADLRALTSGQFAEILE